jgi:NitT/TauT family transport system substrate-binding protein
MIARLGLALLLAVLTLGPAVAQQSGDTTVIRVGAGPDDQSTPVLYAAKAGLYKKYGLDVEVVKLSGAAAIAAALAGGSLEIGKASPMAVIAGFSKGLPFTVIGNLAYYNATRPDLALVVATNGPIKTAKDLEGKTLAAVSLSDLNSVATMAWLEAYGVDLSTIKYVEIPASASLAAMEQDRIVGSTIYEPYFTAFTSSGKARVLGYPYDAIAKRFANAVLFANVSWVAAHRDLVDKFLRATQEASVYLGTHDADSTALIAEFGGLDPASIGNIRHPERGVPTSPADLQPVIDAAAKYKVIDKSFPASALICGCAIHK